MDLSMLITSSEAVPRSRSMANGSGCSGTCQSEPRATILLPSKSVKFRGKGRRKGVGDNLLGQRSFAKLNGSADLSRASDFQGGKVMKTKTDHEIDELEYQLQDVKR